MELVTKMNNNFVISLKQLTDENRFLIIFDSFDKTSSFFNIQSTFIQWVFYLVCSYIDEEIECNVLQKTKQIDFSIQEVSQASCRFN